MRLISDFWIAALLRRAREQGGFGYLVRRGATEAGAIFIVHRCKDGLATLYAPAPQSAYEETWATDERRFIAIMADVEETWITEKLQRELQFDPDIWIVELENIDNPEDFLLLSGHSGF